MDPTLLTIFWSHCLPPSQHLYSFHAPVGLYEFSQTLRQQHDLILLAIFVQHPYEYVHDLSNEEEE